MIILERKVRQKMKIFLVLFIINLVAPIVAMWDVKLTYKDFFKSDK